MEWYKPFVFNMYLTNATANATANAIITANAIANATATVTPTVTTLYYGHNNMTLTESILHSFFIVSDNYSVSIFSAIPTLLLLFALIFYIVLIIDFILRLMFNDYTYENYSYDIDMELINATYMSDIIFLKKLLITPNIDVNTIDISSRLTSLELSVRNGNLQFVEALLTHPHIHNSVARLEHEDIYASPNWLHMDHLIQSWHKKQAVCYAALKGERYLDMPFESAIKILSVEELSSIRDFNGFTTLGNAVAAGNMKYIHALIKAGASLLVAANLSGTSLGTVAIRSGSRAIADMLYYRTLKAFCRRKPMFNRLRSEIIIGNRVNMPRELVNYIMEYVVDIELPPGFIRDG